MKYVFKLFDAFFESSPSQRIGIMAVSLMAIFAAMWLLFISPYLSQRRELRETIAASEEAFQQEGQVQARLRKAEQLVADLTTTEQQIASRLPQAADVDGLLTTISGNANDSGLKLHSFERQEEISRDFFVEIPIKVSVSGRYHQVATFFDELRRLSQLVVVTRFVARTPAMLEDGVEISADCMLSAFRLPSEAEKGSATKR